MKRTTPIYPGKKTARTVLITDPGDSFAVIQFPAFDGPGDGAEIPHDPPLTVQFLLSLLAQFVLRDKSGHDPHLPSAWRTFIITYRRAAGKGTKRTVPFVHRKKQLFADAHRNDTFTAN